MVCECAVSAAIDWVRAESWEHTNHSHWALNNVIFVFALCTTRNSMKRRHCWESGKFSVSMLWWHFVHCCDEWNKITRTIETKTTATITSDPRNQHIKIWSNRVFTRCDAIWHFECADWGRPDAHAPAQPPLTALTSGQKFGSVWFRLPKGTKRQFCEPRSQNVIRFVSIRRCHFIITAIFFAKHLCAGNFFAISSTTLSAAVAVHLFRNAVPLAIFPHAWFPIRRSLPNTYSVWQKLSTEFSPHARLPHTPFQTNAAKQINKFSASAALIYVFWFHWFSASIDSNSTINRLCRFCFKRTRTPGKVFGFARNSEQDVAIQKKTLFWNFLCSSLTHT